MSYIENHPTVLMKVVPDRISIKTPAYSKPSLPNSKHFDKSLKMIKNANMKKVSSNSPSTKQHSRISPRRIGRNKNQNVEERFVDPSLKVNDSLKYHECIKCNPSSKRYKVPDVIDDSQEEIKQVKLKLKKIEHTSSYESDQLTSILERRTLMFR